MVRAGLLRHRVTIQQQVSDTDEWGQPVDTWNDVDTVWGEVRDLQGREFMESRQAPGGEITTRVRIRYRGDMTRQKRIVTSGRVLEIESVLEPTGRSELLELMCREAS